MPTYKVTDPTTGKTLRLTGDSPPTEQELQEIFKTEAPQQSLVDKIKSTATSLWEAGAENRRNPLARMERMLDNPVDLSGLIGVGPVATTTKEAGAGLLSKLRQLFAEKELPAAAKATGTGAQPLETVLSAGTASPGRTGTAFPFKVAAPAAREAAPAFEASATKLPTPAVKVQPKVRLTARELVRAGLKTGIQQPFEPVAEKLAPPKINGNAARRLLSEGEEAGVQQLDDLQRTTQGAEPATKGNGTYTEAAASAKPTTFAEAFAKAQDDAHALASAGKVDEAATTIEKRVQEMVSDFRKTKSAHGSRSSIPGGQNLTTKDVGHIEQSIELGSGLHPRITKIRPTAEANATVEAGRAARHLAYREDANATSRLKALLDLEKGGISPGAASALAGGTVGAAIGGTQGDTTGEHLQNAALGGLAGAVITPLLAHAIASKSPKPLQSAIYGSILSSPQSLMKAWLGGAGGAISLATEKIAAGNVRDGGAILRSIFTDGHVQQIIKGFRTAGQTTGRTQGAPTVLARAFDSVNAPFINAMRKGGVSYDDAVRATLSGVPTTEMGQKVVQLWSQFFSLRLITSLFPRVGVQIIERGLERTPLGLVSKGLQTAGTGGERVARAVMGPAAGLAAYAGGDQVPDWAKPFVAAAAGPYGLPVGVGLAVGRAKEAGKAGKAQLTAATEEFARNLPFPQYGPTDALRPDALAAMLVPNVVRDVARAQDPYERSTRDVQLGRAKAKIPGLRETLPVRGQNVNILGQPNEDRASAVTRFFTPTARDTKPFKDVPPAVAQEIKRLGVDINVPAFQKELEVGKRKLPVPPDMAERARADRRQFVLPLIERLMASPVYQRLTDEQKKARLEAVIKRAEAAGSQKTRAQLMRLLRPGATRAGTR